MIENSFSGLGDFLNRAKPLLAKGPVALIFAEDGTEVESTVQHHLNLGFRQVFLFAPPSVRLPHSSSQPNLHRVTYDTRAEAALTHAINRTCAAAPGTWFYYCFNAEYLFFPFCETRTVGEMLDFHTEERREAMLAFVVDLYAEDISAHPDAVSLETAHLDTSGYYALTREDAENDWQPKERQMDFYGGLRWRFEEFVPYERRKIDRIALFRSATGLKLRDDHTFNMEEYNTYSCPWHHNMTATICSFRTAKALRTNPGSRPHIDNFIWHKSRPFEWSSGQLMDLGLMEPGQWF
ncbi:hypothetical protein C8N32_11058 [Rhodovulum imhoffii]|uniref:Glycosyl transferase family 2 n=1 Tax=Rhodovulum imhoffii TaxID=365340 RepID=A0A2T5BRA7_9RHOB|nr:hypothetical protein [Rhodovulum imhoffii]MBK5934430.1 hypothetical protein [Rhodovulum imhoffii]PTN01777.1 hypothetical protein C8N32_11058 [Rhodovulum imhoffii]